MNRHRVLVLAAGLSAIPAAGAWPDLSHVWTQRYNNAQADYNDYGESIAVDSSGAVYVAGFTFYAFEGGSYLVPRFLTIKYEPDGTQSWVRDYFATQETWASAAWIVRIDPSKNDVVVAGGVHGHEDWGLVKYSSTGTQHWAVTYEADSYYLTEPDDVFIDDAGSVYVTGDIGTFEGPDPQTPVLKYSSTGQLVVNRRYSGPWGLGASGRAIATDAEGNIYVAGTTAMPNLASELFLAKYSPTGAFLWDRTFGNQSQVSHDGARDLLVDENGDIIVVGYLGYNTSAGVDVVLRKYSSSGALLWSTIYDSGTGLDDVVYKLGADSQGNLIGAGYAESSPGQQDIFALMFDAQGQLDWAETYGGAGNSSDTAYDLAVAGDGGIVLAGLIQPFTGVRYAFVADINPEDGGLIDLEEYGGPMDDDTWAAAVALGPQDEVYITGTSADFTTERDVMTQRYDRADDLVSAPLTDMVVAFGQHLGGTLAELQTSDNFYVRVRSRPGFTATEANLIELHIGSDTNVGAPQSLNLAIEGRISQPGGTVRVRLKNWNTNSFQQVHQYAIGMSETTEVISGLSAANRVRASDGRIELSLRSSVFATFSAQGFDQFADWVEIAVGQ